MNTDQRAVADAVRDQLKDDYPPEALDWVDTVDWDGPVDVPVSEIDTSNRSNWIASYEPEKVARFIDAIESGDPNKPIVLYRTPAVSSYVAQVESVDGPGSRPSASSSRRARRRSGEHGHARQR